MKLRDDLIRFLIDNEGVGDIRILTGSLNYTDYQEHSNMTVKVSEERELIVVYYPQGYNNYDNNISFSVTSKYEEDK